LACFRLFIDDDVDDNDDDASTAGDLGQLATNTVVKSVTKITCIRKSWQ